MPSVEVTAADLLAGGAIATALTLASFAARRDLAVPLKFGLPILVIVVCALSVSALMLGHAWRPIALFATLVTVSAMIAETDRRLCLIPDPLVAGLFALAMASPIGVQWSAALLGATLLGGMFLGVRAFFAAVGRREALGLGDVKLAAAIGALLGPYDGLLAAALAGIATLSVAIPSTLLSGGAISQVRIPFGIGLAAALVAVLAFRMMLAP